MNDTAAENLVKTTFENPYSRERFLTFSKNLFHFFEPKTFVYRGKYIPDAYKTHIKTLERLGKYEDQDNNKIDILAVCLKKQSSLERARTMQRNFIAWYLNGSRGNVAKDAALVAFYTKDSNDWRLSLVKMDYSLAKSKAGKIKAITELTPARRFSFSVGKDENTHTAQRQLLPVLQMDERPPTLSDLETAFSVEVVTKDFFEKYKTLFLNTKEALDKIVAKDAKIKSDFTEKNIDTVDFTKKLLGQIVFLYFLQKKGWFGVARDEDWGTGPKDFLRRLFEKQLAGYDNFFNDILEPLFYEALAIERPDDFYSKFNCKIPFLNGGLFDPLDNYDWIHTDILLDDNLFSNSTKTKEGDTGDGILDVFDRYNFTVKEDEPLEREVAVDPEMLGKVFENLLEVKDRKSKGTYYTPREIVHYMCQESLINYLLTELDSKVKRDDIETLIRLGETAVEHDSRVVAHGEETKAYKFKLPKSIRKNASLIDESLEKIKACDPAVGSGAFLVGMMTEVIRTRNTLSSYLPKNNRSIYAFKRHAIQNCLYGVDIDPGAVEIAKLRLWLSLVVDEQERENIQPLPNLDYKIMQGNSLLEEYEGVKLDLDGYGQPQQMKFDQAKSEPEVLKEKLVDLRKEFFRTAYKKEKDSLKRKIEELTWQLIEASLREQRKLLLLSEIEHFKKTNTRPFFLWKLNFSEVFEGDGGFDVMIANPPYVQFQKLDVKMRNTLRKHKYYESQSDLWYFFVYKAFELLSFNGILNFIVSNYFLDSAHAKTLRTFITDNFSIDSLLDFRGTKVFESASINTLVFHLRKIESKSAKIKYFIASENSFSDGVHLRKKLIDASNFSNGRWFILDEEETRIINKIKDGSELLGDISDIGTGVKTGDDEIFVLSTRKADSLGIEKAVLKKWIKNSDIQKYYYIDSDKLVIYTDKYTNINEYPNAKNYLYKYRKRLTKKWKVRGEKTEFWKLYRAREQLFCDKHFKLIICPYKSPTNRFSLGTNVTGSGDIYVIKLFDEEKVYMVLGFLNSTLGDWINKKMGKRKGLLYEYYTEPLTTFPIKKTTQSDCIELNNLVGKIIEVTEDENFSDNELLKKKVETYENQIDQLIYKLYGLTPEEIEIVEGSTERN